MSGNLTTWAIGIAISIFSLGVGSLRLKRPSALIPRICFTITAIIVLALIEWPIIYELPISEFLSWFLGVTVFGVIFLIWALALRAINRQAAAPIVQPIIIQPPLVGNLKQRTIALSNEIMEDLIEHGWPQSPQWRYFGPTISKMPPSSAPREEHIKWDKNRSNYFMQIFYDKVVKIRNEYSQLHLQDNALDDFLARVVQYIAVNKQPQRNELFIFSIDIAGVADSLMKLANQI